MVLHSCVFIDLAGQHSSAPGFGSARACQEPTASCSIQSYVVHCSISAATWGARITDCTWPTDQSIAELGLFRKGSTPPCRARLLEWRTKAQSSALQACLTDLFALSERKAPTLAHQIGNCKRGFSSSSAQEALCSKIQKANPWKLRSPEAYSYVRDTSYHEALVWFG